MTIRCNLTQHVITLLLLFYPLQILMAEPSLFIIDDRSADDFNATSGNEWKLVTDDVMGGVSKGQLTTGSVQDRKCLLMQGDVKLDNNGGFIQTTLNLSEDVLKTVPAYTGIMLDVYGNDEEYNVHLRTRNTWLPWQSYRATFSAPQDWTTIYIPFTDFKPYRISKELNIGKLKRIGLVAIGREFSADLCIGKIGLYR